MRKLQTSLHDDLSEIPWVGSWTMEIKNLQLLKHLMNVKRALGTSSFDLEAVRFWSKLVRTVERPVDHWWWLFFLFLYFLQPLNLELLQISKGYQPFSTFILDTAPQLSLLALLSDYRGEQDASKTCSIGDLWWSDRIPLGPEIGQGLGHLGSEVNLVFFIFCLCVCV